MPKVVLLLNLLGAEPGPFLWGKELCPVKGARGES